MYVSFSLLEMCSHVDKTFMVWNTSSDIWLWLQLKVSHNSFRRCPHVHRYFQNQISSFIKPSSVKPCCKVRWRGPSEGSPTPSGHPAVRRRRQAKNSFPVWRFLVTWNIVNVFGRPRNTHRKALYQETPVCFITKVRKPWGAGEKKFLPIIHFQSLI